MNNIQYQTNLHADGFAWDNMQSYLEKKQQSQEQQQILSLPGTSMYFSEVFYIVITYHHNYDSVLHQS